MTRSIPFARLELLEYHGLWRRGSGRVLNEYSSRSSEPYVDVESDPQAPFEVALQAEPYPYPYPAAFAPPPKPLLNEDEVGVLGLVGTVLAVALLGAVVPLFMLAMLVVLMLDASWRLMRRFTRGSVLARLGSLRSIIVPSLLAFA